MDEPDAVAEALFDAPDRRLVHEYTRDMIRRSPVRVEMHKAKGEHTTFSHTLCEMCKTFPQKGTSITVNYLFEMSCETSASRTPTVARSWCVARRGEWGDRRDRIFRIRGAVVSR